MLEKANVLPHVRFSSWRMPFEMSHLRLGHRSQHEHESARPDQDRNEEAYLLRQTAEE